ncbi:hypothetical protein [Streptomyces phaeochromogenes]|uniref:hypothetical protein n=1 Tax=Streptomyces phaeochromogenes TaxID=1923 RepID=UPI0036C55F02
MSNKVTSASDGDPDKEYPDVVEPVLDLDLRMLLMMLAEDRENNSHVGISLNIPGGIIYGHAISREAYLEEWEENVRHAEGAGAELIAQLPRMVANALDEALGDRDLDPLPRWIHLREATFLTGAPVQTMHFNLWRGRIADISGWSLSLPS